jgi:hypothetical protein
LGGVNEEVYNKLRKDFGIASPKLSKMHSFHNPKSSMNHHQIGNDNDMFGSPDKDNLAPTIIYSKKLGAGHETGRFDI